MVYGPRSSSDSRLHAAIRWRRTWLEFQLMRILARMGPRWLVALRWPWPVRKPYQRKELRIRAPGGGMGDELMCTPLFRAVKKANPECRITFISRYPELFRGNPNIDAVETFSENGGRNCLQVRFGHAVPPLRPVTCLLAECVGLVIRDARLDCMTPPVDPELATEVAGISRPYVAIQVCASGNTLNKEWPTRFWEELIRLLCAEYDVVEVGTSSPVANTARSPRFHSLVGRTDLGGLVQVIRNAGVFVGPVSGGMHVANSFSIPSVIIHGGREGPDAYGYTNTLPLYSDVECAPCWRDTACPCELKCLAAISPLQVLAAVRRQFQSSADMEELIAGAIV